MISAEDIDEDGNIIFGKGKGEAEDEEEDQQKMPPNKPATEANVPETVADTAGATMEVEEASEQKKSPRKKPPPASHKQTKKRKIHI